jgi:hypothetical protein
VTVTFPVTRTDKREDINPRADRCATSVCFHI